MLHTFVLQTSNEGNGKPSEHSAVEQKSDTPTSSDVGRTENGGKAEVYKTEESWDKFKDELLSFVEWLPGEKVVLFLHTRGI